jgi:hypothetical protein
VIGEIILYFTAGATRLARRSGLLTQSVGLWSRSRRRKREWGQHYARCHGVIREVLADKAPGRKVVVLGSGLAEDVPLDVLAAKFESIILVDIVHLKPVRRRISEDARLSGKVRFDVRDLTGLLEALTRSMPLPSPLPEPLADFQSDPAVDLVISAMCLSQLPRAAETLLQQTLLTRSEQQDVLAGLIERHVRALIGFSCPAILLTDTAYQEIAPDGAVIARHGLLHGVPLPSPMATWDWDVAPKGEVSGGISYRHEVGAWFFAGKGADV